MQLNARQHAQACPIQDRANLAPTIRAVAFTALTTAIGFGALVFAEHRGMRSLGITMAIGSLACMYVACVVLPTVLAAMGYAKSNAKSNARSKGKSNAKPRAPSGSA